MGTDVTLAQLAGYCEHFGLLNRVDERGWVETMMRTQHGMQWVILRIVGERQVMEVRMPGLLTVREERRAVVGHALACVNRAILLGAFSLDPQDGEVAYAVPIPYAGQGVGQDQVGQCLAAARWTLNRFLPGIQQLCHGEGTVEDALWETLGLPLPGAAQALARAAGASEEGPGPAGAGH
jgi:hypothetical protein